MNTIQQVSKTRTRRIPQLCALFCWVGLLIACSAQGGYLTPELPAPQISREMPTLIPQGNLIASTVSLVDTPPAASPTLQASQTSTLTPIPTFTDNPTPLPTRVTWNCLVNKETRQARVVKVTDGDTFEVEINGETFKVRYIGINAPPNQDASGIGDQAYAQNKAWVENQSVTLVRDTSQTDRYGRLLRYVLLGDAQGGLFINLELVRLGMAQAAPYPPDTACQELFTAAQEQARLEKAGMWSNLALTAVAFQTVTSQVPRSIATEPASRKANPQGGEACNCTGADLDCKDFGTRAEAQACFEHCVAQGYGDIFRLDGDGDGKVCETKP